MKEFATAVVKELKKVIDLSLTLIEILAVKQILTPEDVTKIKKAYK